MTFLNPWSEVMDNKRPTWAEIDLGAIRHNLRCIKEKVSPSRVMTIVKADAYGHGTIPVCQVCLEEGVDFLGVATLDEALLIRQAGIEIPILILGYVPGEYAAEVVMHQLRAAVFTKKFAEALSKAAVKIGKKARLHIKIDTGMGRLGFNAALSTADMIQDIIRMPGIEAEGIFTHFAVADIADKTYTFQQLQRFTSLLKELERRGIDIPFKHCANSAALIDMPATHLNMVRAGIILYGLYPSVEVNKKKLDLIPAMRLKSKISFLKLLPRGYTISYGRTYSCEKDTLVATVPLGYADGYSRLLSNKAWGVVRGQRVPLIGNVCMDQCMFDVTGVEGVNEGDEIILWGRPDDGVTADDLAGIIGTINYEVISSLTSRVPRVYV